jgi:hypothetical protein
MKKEDKQRLSELYVQRQMIGYRQMYYAFRNIPSVSRCHPVRSCFAVVLISFAFLGVYLFINNSIPPDNLNQVANVPIIFLALTCCLLFLFGQSASFDREWTHGRELSEANDRLSREIKELMRNTTQ